VAAEAVAEATVSLARQD
jgi:hypothetical protein